MKLQFEEWVMQKQFSDNVTNLFSESTICFKNSAYRASLLFCYLSFLTILKELIIKATKPASIPQGRWDDLIRKLQNDDTWEKGVYDELVNSTSSIFNINEILRQQIKYWKDRRNDCAHFKSNEISSQHVESFWSFVTSNLLKITLEGGKDNLLKKFEIHFDPTFTPPSADISHLIREINESVDTSQLSAFWEELLLKVDPHRFISMGESHGIKIFNAVFKLCNESAKESLSLYLKAMKYDLIVANLYPENIHYFKYSPQEIREIWRTRIIQNKPIAFSIYSSLLRNNLIPSSEIDEANKHLINELKEQAPHNELIHNELASTGFGEAIFELAIHDDRLNDWYLFVNPRADMIAYYIDKYPLKEETVEVVCEMYTRNKYSYWLGDRLVRIFTENPNKKMEFHSIANTKGYTIPRELQ